MRIDVIYPSCDKPKPEDKCHVRHCPYPRHDSEECRFHERFFAFKESMTDTTLDIGDMYDDEDPSSTLLYLANQTEVKLPGIPFAELPGVRFMLEGYTPANLAEIYKEFLATSK